MKKLFATALILVFVLHCFCGCGKLAENGGKAGLDVFAGLEISFGSEGWRARSINGCGYLNADELELDLDKIDYDKTNSDVKNFLKSIDFYWVEKEDMQYKLRNGDTVTIAMEYSKSTAEELGIQILEQSKTYTVTGLIEIYSHPSEIPQSELEKIMEFIDYENRMKEYYDIQWYLDGGDDECEYLNFNCSFEDVRTFCQYDVTDTGETYAKYLVVLACMHKDFLFRDGDYEAQINDRCYDLYRVDLDKSGDPYSFDYNDDSVRLVECFRAVDEGSGQILDLYPYGLEEDGSVSYVDEDSGDRVMLEEVFLF